MTEFAPYRPSILIVDDEPNYLIVLSEILKDEGFEVFTANSGKAGLPIVYSTDLDGTSVEALADFAAQMRQWNLPLVLARTKDAVRELLARVDMAALPASAYAAWSVDDAVAALNGAGESETASAG